MCEGVNIVTAGEGIDVSLVDGVNVINNTGVLEVAASGTGITATTTAGTVTLTGNAVTDLQAGTGITGSKNSTTGVITVSNSGVLSVATTGTGITATTTAGTVTLTGSAVDISSNQTISSYKTFTNAILQNIISGTISSNILTCNYAAGTIFYCNNPGANFTLDLTNFPTSVSAAPYCVTLIINKTTSSSNAFYANTLLINGVSTSVLYNGGTTAVTTALTAPTGANTIVQQFTIYYTTGPVRQPVIGSVNVYF